MTFIVPIWVTCPCLSQSQQDWPDLAIGSPSRNGVGSTSPKGHGLRTSGRRDASLRKIRMQLQVTFGAGLAQVKNCPLHHHLGTQQVHHGATYPFFRTEWQLPQPLGNTPPRLLSAPTPGLACPKSALSIIHPSHVLTPPKAEHMMFLPCSRTS